MGHRTGAKYLPEASLEERAAHRAKAAGPGRRRGGSKKKSRRPQPPSTRAPKEKPYSNPVMRRLFQARRAGLGNRRLSHKQFKAWLRRWLDRRWDIAWSDWPWMLNRYSSDPEVKARIETIIAAASRRGGSRMAGGLPDFRSPGSGQTRKG